MESKDWKEWVSQNKVALAIGVAVVLVVSAMTSGEETQRQGQPYQGGQPMGDYPDQPMPYSDGGGDGEFDMDEWRREQRRDDRRQQEEIDVIREVERCYDPETGEVIEVPISVGCS